MYLRLDLCVHIKRPQLKLLHGEQYSKCSCVGPDEKFRACIEFPNYRSLRLLVNSALCSVTWGMHIVLYKGRNNVTPQLNIYKVELPKCRN